MKSIDKLKLFGNAITSSVFNPYTSANLNWTSVWNACRSSLVLDSAISADLLSCVLTTPVCVTSEIASIELHNNVIWVGCNVLQDIHPDLICAVVENTYQNMLDNMLPSHDSVAKIISEPKFDFWNKNVWEASTVDRWKKWVHDSCHGLPVGPWTTLSTTAERFRSCAISEMAKNTSDLVRLQTGSQLVDVLEYYCGNDLSLEQMLVVKQLCELCLPQDTAAREEVVKSLAVEWVEKYSDGPEVEQMLSLVTGTEFREAQRWKDNLDVHWLRIAQNWTNTSHAPCSTPDVLNALLSAYSPTASPAVNDWIDLYIQAHVETNTPMSDFTATHITLARPQFLPKAFSVLTNVQKKVAEEAAESGLFPELQKSLDSLAPKNVVRFPIRHPFAG